MPDFDYPLSGSGLRRGGAVGAEVEGAEDVFGPIAIAAKGLKARRKAVFHEPLVEQKAASPFVAFAKFPQMVGTAAVNVVDRQKNSVSRSAAYARRAVCGKYRIGHPSPCLTFGAQINPTIARFCSNFVTRLAPRFPLSCALSKKFAQWLDLCAGSASSLPCCRRDLIIRSPWTRFVATLSLCCTGCRTWSTNCQATIRSSNHHIDISKMSTRWTPRCSLWSDRSSIFRLSSYFASSRLKPSAFAFATVGTYSSPLRSFIEKSERDTLSTLRTPSVTGITGDRRLRHSFIVGHNSSEDRQN